MNLFLLTFFVIYGAVHLYLLLRARQCCPMQHKGALALLCWLVLMVAAPVAVRLLEREGYEAAARLTAYIGYGWMGWLFLFVVLMTALDLVRLGRHLLCYFVRLPAVRLLEPRPRFWLCVLVALGVCGYGLYEAQQLRVEQVTLVTDKLPPGTPRLRIAQISDLHIGLIVREQQVRHMLAALEAAKPDLLVATGDIVDGHVSHFDGVSDLFRQLAPPLGMLAIPGNHEYYAGFGQSRNFLERSGFTLLRGAGQAVGTQIWAVGVDDPVAAQRGEFRSGDEQQLLGQAANGRFVLLLKHRPTVAPQSRGQFDLQLSGHVHKGQIVPFNLLTWLQFPVRAGLTALPERGWLYVSRGTGTWGPPIRFLAPPEVTLIDLVPSATSTASAGRSSRSDGSRRR